MLHFKQAFRIFFQTLPFVLLRLALGTLFAMLALVYFGIVLYILFTFLGFSNTIMFLVSLAIFIAAVGFFFKLYQLFVRNVMYMIKAGHIAVISEIVQTGQVPKGQISYGKDKVIRRFMSVEALFVVDMAIEAVVRQIIRSLASVVEWLPVPALRTFINTVLRIVEMAANYIDEAILAYIFINEDQNAWKSARDGLVLYAKNWKPILGVSAALVLSSYFLSFLIFNGFYIIGIPLATKLLPGLGIYIAWAIFIALVLIIFMGIFQPFVQTWIIVNYLNEIRDDTPDSKTMDWLMGISDKFKEIITKAGKSMVKKRPAPAPASQKCAICGKDIAEGEGYRCESCNKIVDYNCARTYEGKIYCINCLKKMGLM